MLTSSSNNLKKMKESMKREKELYNEIKSDFMKISQRIKDDVDR